MVYSQTNIRRMDATATNGYKKIKRFADCEPREALENSIIVIHEKLGRLDSNQRMAEPKTAALPLGDTPV
jgi:hypothetical protein